MQGKILEEIAQLALTLAPREGVFPSASHQLHVTRTDAPTLPASCMAAPGLCLVVQGRKVTTIGTRQFELSAGSCIAGSLAIPDTYQIVQASRDQPFLAIVVSIDRARLADLAGNVPETKAASQDSGAPFTQMEASGELLDAFERLLKAELDPEGAAILEPLILQEILFRTLRSPAGRALRSLVQANTPEHRVGQAIFWLTEHFREPLSIDELAARVHLGSSTFYRHFKNVTSVSPLQYHKQLRLYEARRLMAETGMDATGAALTVGYESPTQFSREYKRLFGMPPRRHIKAAEASAKLRAAAA